MIGPIRLIHTSAPHLASGGSTGCLDPDGHASGLVYVPLPATPTHRATKAAVHSYTESLREQLGKTSVQVI